MAQDDEKFDSIKPTSSECLDPIQLNSLGELLPASTGTFASAGPNTFVPGEATMVFPRRWGPYEITAFVGEGGMGRVYRAEDPRLKRTVAIKFLRGDDPVQVRRLLKEAQAQARVEHEHICRIYEASEIDGRPYIAMQYVDGETLQHAYPRMTLPQKVLVLRQVAGALHEAHRRGLIHRDIKPSNIMVELLDSGTWKPYVTDFGLARETAATDHSLSVAMAGTPLYMAPEQALGDPGRLDRRTDVYGLGATLYEILSARRLFDGQTPMLVLLQVIETEPAPLRKLVPALPADMDTIVMKCLEKDPQRRYESALALADDLGRFLDGEPVLARRAGPIYRILKKARKHWVVSTLTAVAVMAIAMLSGMWLHERAQTVRRVELAQRFTQKLERVENLLWREYVLESHDIRPARKQVRKRLEEIEREMRTIGASAQGPGQASLGRGYRILADYERARAYLEMAWREEYRPPEVAYDLGLTLSQLYNARSGQLDEIRNRDDRERQRQKLKQEFQVPATKFLRLCSGSDAANPRYLAALLAYLDGRFPEALEHCRAAFHEFPWFYEAKLLESQVLQMMADEKAGRGEYGTAESNFGQAQEALRTAARVGRSDPGVFARTAEAYLHWLNFQIWERNRSAPEALARALEACQAGLQVAPDSVHLMILESQAHLLQATRLVKDGQNPAESLKLCIRTAGQVLRQQANHLAALHQLASAYWESGKFRLNQGQNPLEDLKIALGYQQQLLNRIPGSTDALMREGNIHLEIGNYQAATGVDPAASLDRAIGSYQRALAGNPDSVSIIVNLGLAAYLQASWQVSQGEGDPRPGVEKALASLRGGLRLNPNSFWIFRSIGGLHFELAMFESLQDRDPRQDLAEARTNLEKAQEMSSGDWFTMDLLYRTYVELALAELDLGGNPSGVFPLAAQLLRRYPANSPQVAKLQSQMMDLELIQAEWATRHEGASFSAYAGLDRRFQQLLRENPDDPGILAGLLGFHLSWAESLVSRGLPADREIARGEAVLDRIQLLTQDKATTALYRGHFRTVAAKGTKNPPKRAELAMEALTCFEQYLAVSPRLIPRDRRRIEEARRLAGPPGQAR